ncbi:MAG: LPS export ABC transporter permease LptG [Deltaproteobacteria bacterium]|nr:LPS export ABC transporter permease LptG [Deltaproteobacteria bacterium]
MKILEKYIISEFTKLLIISVLSFIVLFIMVDLFENMDNLMKYNVPILASFVFFLYKVPFIIGQVSPIAVLVAVLLSLGLFSKHGEITAMKAGGIRLLRVLAPLLAFGIGISLFVIFINEYITPTALKKVDTFRKEWFGIQGSSFGKEGVWLKTNKGIINIKQVDLTKNQLNGVTYYIIEKPFVVKKRIQARKAEWKNNQWIADSAFIWNFTERGEAFKSEASDVLLEGIVEPVDLANVENIHKNMSFGELREYVKSLEDDGYEATKYKIDLYGKLAFPIVNFIMVLVGISFALKTGRHSGIAAGVGLSIVIAFSYWVVFALTKSLGQSGMVPPMLAAFFPDMLFFAIGALMFGYVRQ